MGEGLPQESILIQGETLQKGKLQSIFLVSGPYITISLILPDCTYKQENFQRGGKEKREDKKVVKPHSPRGAEARRTCGMRAL